MKTKWIILVLVFSVAATAFGQATGAGAKPGSKRGDRPLRELVGTCTSGMLNSEDFSSFAAYGAYKNMCEGLAKQNGPLTGARITNSQGGNGVMQAIRQGIASSTSGQNSGGKLTTASSSPSPSSKVTGVIAHPMFNSSSSKNAAIETMMNRKIKIKVKPTAKVENTNVTNGTPTTATSQPSMNTNPFDLIVSSSGQTQCTDQFSETTNFTFSGPDSEKCCPFIWTQIQAEFLPASGVENIDSMALLSQWTDAEGVAQLRTQTMQNYRFSEETASVEHDFSLLAHLLSYSAKAFGPRKVAVFKGKILQVWRQAKANKIHQEIREEVDKELAKASEYISDHQASSSQQQGATPMAASAPGPSVAAAATAQSAKKQSYNEKMNRLRTMCQATFANLQATQVKTETQR